MSGLFALLDDVAAMVKLTASSLDDIAAGAGRASIKAAGVVVDDAAVTPRYVQGLKPERELSIIWRIAKGSLRNKLLIILPVALLLSQFAPFLLTPILMVGGTYLCYEGAEKIWEKISGHEAKAQDPDEVAATDAAAHEKQVVSSATRTDFILSAEIMVIALNEVDSEPLLSRAIILLVVAVLITALVYGAVGLIVKMDDAGLALAQRPGKAVPGSGVGWSTPCPSCCRPCPGSGWWPCSGSAATSCWWEPTNSACTRPTTWSITSRWPSMTPPGDSVRYSAGSPTRSSRPCSGWWWGPWSSSCFTCCRSAGERPTQARRMELRPTDVRRRWTFGAATFVVADVRRR